MAAVVVVNPVVGSRIPGQNRHSTEAEPESLGIMSTKSPKVFCLSLSGFILLLTVGLVFPRPPAVTLRFCGFQTNQWERVSAIIEVTNCSRRAVLYRAYQKPEYAEYVCLHQIDGCWTNYASVFFRCGTGAELAGLMGR